MKMYKEEEWEAVKINMVEEPRDPIEVVAIKNKITIRIITKVTNKIQINPSWVEMQEFNNNQTYSKT